MKKRFFLLFGIGVILIGLFFPFSYSSYDDGGTREYKALTYKVIAWNALVTETDETGGFVGHSIYKNTSVFLYPDNRKSIGELWQMEISK